MTTTPTSTALKVIVIVLAVIGAFTVAGALGALVLHAGMMGNMGSCQMMMMGNAPTA
ncbi:hypothetical protein [Crenobacter cavernae]|uniref:hypothetical protein n=1 Tax=Crenobacter cavernae TaxID=2290923 RepID=UPI0015F14442|nr:hypothetical protein [Crenobacter cavernae]